MPGPRIVIIPEISLIFNDALFRDSLTSMEIISDGGLFLSSLQIIFFSSEAKLMEQVLNDVLTHKKVKIKESHIFHQTQILEIL